jgi:large subunit ribosomal protein L5
MANDSVLYKEYLEVIRPKLMESLGRKNALAVPRLKKIVVSSGVGASKEPAVFDEAVKLLGDITGQRPVITKARQSVANFKVREGMNVGVTVTLRGRRMYDFLYRLINISLPRVHDFRGLSPKGFDGFGNYSLGVSDQSIFTEVNLDKMKHTIGMNVCIVTTAKTNEAGLALLTQLGMPFAK